MDLNQNNEKSAEESEVITSEKLEHIASSEDVKEIKYANEIANVEAIRGSTCIGVGYSEQDLEAFRWTFEDINNSNNFRPRALLLDETDPKKKQTVNSCGGWSLSFFVTEKDALNKLTKICADKKFLYKKLGTHIAKGNIYKKDGKCGDFNREGHFEHFEYKKTDFSTSFKVIRKVS